MFVCLKLTAICATDTKGQGDDCSGSKMRAAKAELIASWYGARARRKLGSAPVRCVRPAGLECKPSEAASTTDGTRATRFSPRALGSAKSVFHGNFSPMHVKNGPLAVCEANGLLHADGDLAVQAPLHNGIARAKNDIHCPPRKNLLGKRKKPALARGLHQQ